MAGMILLAGGALTLLCSDDSQLATSLVQAAEYKFESREAEIADALEKNGPIFEGWTKPDLVLVFSGENGWLP